MLILPGSLEFPSWKPPLTHWLEHTNIGKITKPFYQRAQRVCLGPAHISNVFQQTIGHLCLFCLGNDKQGLGKVQQIERNENWHTTVHAGTLFSATATLRNCSCFLSSKRKKSAKPATNMKVWDKDWEVRSTSQQSLHQKSNSDSLTKVYRCGFWGLWFSIINF